ncbi:MAG TPA: LytTR family DNA-binding domain-containing protein [Chitinophagaceae bacterium]|jgi:two-component system, LytTR family, response regulator|nr:LytTR family DNA-binding domain-containing protein [Chitinophagaceae bacterium]
MDPLTKNYSCIIVDDNELDRLAVLSYVRRYPFIRVEGVFESAAKSIEFVQKNEPPDILFLDIDMPGMNGLELRKQLQKIPACIFVTSHPEFALESFEMAALDYLVKPLKADRFEKTMQRLEHFLEIHFKAELLDYTLGEDTLFIKDGHNHIKLKLHEIIYLEALKDYTGIITGKKKYCVLTPLGNLLKEKAFQTFIRIHRSYAIQKHFIKQISSKEVMVNDMLLPVGRSYRETVEKLIAQ